MAQKVIKFGSFANISESLSRVKDFSSYVGIFESDEAVSFFIGDSFAKVYYDKVLPFTKQGNSIFLGEEGNQEEDKTGLYFPSSGDLTLKKFKNLISNYSTEQPKATYVFLFTSTVDSIENFEKNNQNVRNAREIRKGLGKIFPNVANFFVPVLGDPSDKDRQDYYLGVWQSNGFNKEQKEKFG